MRRTYKVKSLPHVCCKGCALNGCYPWNKCPAALCAIMGGLAPPVLTVDKPGPINCSSWRDPEGLWTAYVNDRKREAHWNEQLREQALKGSVTCNQPMPTLDGR